MRLGYQEFRARDAEVVAITATPPERGAQYHQLYRFPHPYLCDPERATARRYGVLPSVGVALRKGIKFLASPALQRQFRSTGRELGSLPGAELRASGSGEAIGCFVVCKQGLVRFARTGAGTELLPSNVEIAQLLDELSVGP